MIEIDTETAIIGGGQTGVPLARALAAAGQHVVVVEWVHLGGCCVNFSCTPISPVRKAEASSLWADSAATAKSPEPGRTRCQ